LEILEFTEIGNLYPNVFKGFNWPGSLVLIICRKYFFMLINTYAGEIKIIKLYGGARIDYYAFLT